MNKTTGIIAAALMSLAVAVPTAADAHHSPRKVTPAVHRVKPCKHTSLRCVALRPVSHVRDQMHPFRTG